MDVSFFAGEGFPIEEYDAAFSSYQINNVPLGNKPQIDASWIHNNDYTLLERTNNVPMYQHGTCPSNDFIISLPNYEDNSLEKYMQHGEGDHQGFMVSPNQECYWFFEEQVKTINFALDKKAVERNLTDIEIDAFINRSALNKRLDISLDNLKYVSYLSSELLKQTTKQTMTASAMSEQLESLALYALMLPKLDITTRRNRRKIVLAKAVDYMRGNFSQKLVISQIASYASTTVRNLQFLFKEELGVTPIEYLNLFRLYQFHLILQQEQTIVDAAKRCGLTHMGRVSTLHKQLFGVTPSEYRATLFTPKLHNWYGDNKILRHFI